MLFFIIVITDRHIFLEMQTDVIPVSTGSLSTGSLSTGTLIVQSINNDKHAITGNESHENRRTNRDMRKTKDTIDIFTVSTTPESTGSDRSAKPESAGSDRLSGGETEVWVWLLLIIVN